MSTETITDAEVKHSAYTLADKADVRSPDRDDSPGAEFLLRVQRYANEADAQALLESIREYVVSGEDAEDYGANDLSDDLRDSIHEWADSSVNIYTYAAWQEFTDLCLWEEDLSELGEVSGEDLTRDVAQRAAYLVASRLLPDLLAERARLLYDANPESKCAHCGDPANEVDNIVYNGEVYCDDECCDAENGPQEPMDMSGSRPERNGDR